MSHGYKQLASGQLLVNKKMKLKSWVKTVLAKTKNPTRAKYITSYKLRYNRNCRPMEKKRANETVLVIIGNQVYLSWKRKKPSMLCPSTKGLGTLKNHHNPHRKLLQ